MQLDYTNFSRLETGHLQEDTKCIHPDISIEDFVTLDDPATTVFTDFETHRPYMAHGDISTKEARSIMYHSGVKSLFVTDHESHIIGQVSLRELEGIKKNAAAQEHGVTPNEVTIAMVMTPFDQVPTLNYLAIEGSRVGHIARLFHELGSNYIVVVEQIGATEAIRGLFAISRVSLMLGMPITSDLSSHSLSEINHRLI